MEWKKTESVYSELQKKYQNELTTKLKSRFDRFAILGEWNFADPSKCLFEEQSHGALGDKIPDAVDAIIRKTVFEPEEFEEHVELLAENSDSIGKLLKDLREPRPGGKPCIPWLGEIEVKERVIRMCANGQIAINARGEMLQASPGEDTDAAWNRMKGKLGTGKHLDETTLHKPDAVVTSGGKVKTGGTGTGTGNGTAGGNATAGGSPGMVGEGPGIGAGTTITGGIGAGPGNPFIDNGTTAVRTAHTAPPTSGLNLLGQVESWGIKPATPVTNIALKIPKMTGSQLQQLLKHLPDGVTYGLDLEKETN
jgi:hypothetical protein